MRNLTHSDTALQQLKKLEKQPQTRILSTLERCRILPHNHVKKLVGNPYFSLRAGDYRIILDIHDDKLVILVIELGHRKAIYKQY